MTELVGRGRRIAAGAAVAVAVGVAAVAALRYGGGVGLGRVAITTMSTQQPAAAQGVLQPPRGAMGVTAIVKPAQAFKGDRVTIIAVAPPQATAVRVKMPQVGWVDMEPREAMGRTGDGWRRWELEFQPDLPPGDQVLPVRAEWDGGAAETAVILYIKP